MTKFNKVIQSHKNKNPSGLRPRYFCSALFRPSGVFCTALSICLRRWYSLSWNKIWFLIILFSFLVYSCFFIYKTTFFVDGKRYFSLFDDEMISMRYAKNLAHGYGLVWNPGGEKVEGFTNFLWVLYMTIFHLLPIDQSKVSFFIQVSGIVFLLANLYFVKKITNLVFSKSTTTFLAVLLVAFYYPLIQWGFLALK